MMQKQMGEEKRRKISKIKRGDNYERTKITGNKAWQNVP